MGFTFNPMLALGFIMLVATVWFFFKAQGAPKKENPFDFAQAFQNEDNRTSMSRVLMWIGGMAATWIVLDMAVEKTLTWEFFGVYVTGIVLGKVGSDYVAKN